jgi:inosine/xanthosine triphosphate pyrophosphatase family protein
MHRLFPTAQVPLEVCILLVYKIGDSLGIEVGGDVTGRHVGEEAKGRGTGWEPLWLPPPEEKTLCMEQFQ